MSTDRLRRLQEWLAHVTMHPATADRALRSRFAASRCARRDVLAGRVTTPPPAGPGNLPATIEERLQVYNGGYLTRLRRVLEVDFPALRHALGDGFAALADAYVFAHPSKHPDLGRFGQHLPTFVARRRTLERRAFCADLCRYEWLHCEAFCADEFEPLTPAALQNLTPQSFAQAHLRANPSLRLARFAHDVVAYHDRVLADDAPTMPDPALCCVAVHRQETRVRAMALTTSGYAVLAAITSGQALGTALQRAGPDDDVATWFRDWAAAGLFTAIVS